MQIQVLGTGCQNCKITYSLIEAAAADAGLAIDLSKVERIQDIMAFGIFSTPGVVVDGKVVHAGGVPSKAKIAEWLRGDGDKAEPSGGDGGGGGSSC